MGILLSADCDFQCDITEEQFNKVVESRVSGGKDYTLVCGEHEGCTYHWQADDGTGIYLSQSDGQYWLGLDHSTQQKYGHYIKP